MTTIKENQIREHLEAIDALIGIKGFTPETAFKIWRSLRRLEEKARRLALLHAESREYDERGTWEEDSEKIESKIKSYFVNSENVHFDSDPRGAALKIEGDFRKAVAFKDWGGNIEIAPRI